jgi:hypothetical protein
MSRLSDEQLIELVRIKTGILKIQKLIDQVNHAAAQTGLPLRQIVTWPAALMANDISQLNYSHDIAVQLAQVEAMQRLEDQRIHDGMQGPFINRREEVAA